MQHFKNDFLQILNQTSCKKCFHFCFSLFFKLNLKVYGLYSEILILRQAKFCHEVPHDLQHDLGLRVRAGPRPQHPLQLAGGPPDVVRPVAGREGAAEREAAAPLVERFDIEPFSDFSAK